MEKNKIKEITEWHSRGGQGGITGANTYIKAVFYYGKYKGVMSLPSIGAERRGAPIKAYTKISKEIIRDYSISVKPDIILILDKTLKINLNNLKPEGKVIINIPRKVKTNYKTYEIPADDIAIKYNLPNAIGVLMAAALIKITKNANLKSLEKVILEEDLPEKNINAVRELWKLI